jgi:BirA family biotin operon repressor/biotin-[acetyl-CoA-carboxylase] ligase
VRWYAEVDSTNDVAGALADQGAREGTVVVANCQTSGRGRQGRSWASPAGAGLYLSVILRPGRPVPLMTIATGVAVVEGFREAIGLRAELKWPNDVHLGGRKVAGILAEGAEARVVVGVGINVRHALFPPDVAAGATWIEREVGRPVDRGLVLAACLVALAERYRDVQSGHPERVVAAWRMHAGSTIGRDVEWTVGTGWRRGRAEAIDQDGALLVRDGQRLVRVTSGEVRWA